MTDNDTNVAFGWLPELPDHRDQPYLAMRMAFEAPAVLPARVDLRASMPPVYDQGQIGSCTANAIGAAFEFNRIKQGVRDFMPSRLFIYWNEREMEGWPNEDRGAYLRDGIKSIATQGLCEETDWPYDPGRLYTKPGNACYQSALKYRAISYYRLDSTNLHELRACLAAGFPFVFGFTVYQSFMTANSNGGHVPMPGPEKVLGGHAVLAVGYDDASETFIIRNSWGAGRGDKGYYYMPYPYLTSALSDDFWTVRTVTSLAMTDDTAGQA